MMELLLARVNAAAVLFGMIAVAAFWFAIQLCWSVVGKRWYSVVGRVVGALVLLGVGVVMIFFTAFGAD
jgi:hypothetical protein